MTTTTETETETETETGSAEGPAYRKAIEAVRLDHQMAVADQIASQNEYNERMRRAVNAEAGVNVEDEEGGTVGSTLTIDSPTTIHNHATEDGTKNRKTLGTIAKLAVGSGLLATGAGGYAGGTIIWDALRESSIVKQVEPTPTPETPGERSRYSLDLGD